MVCKEELLGAVWADVIVGDDSLTQCVTEIRRALGPTSRDIIKTVPRRGYMLNMQATSFDGAPATPGATLDALPLPSRPSIAVLPFTNLGGLPQEDYFPTALLKTSSPSFLVFPSSS